MAEMLVAYGRPVILCGEGQWAGVWDLERLTDDEVISLGLWLAMKIRPEAGQGNHTTGG